MHVMYTSYNKHIIFKRIFIMQFNDNIKCINHSNIYFKLNELFYK